MNECLTTPQHENRSAIGCQNKVDYCIPVTSKSPYNNINLFIQVSVVYGEVIIVLFYYRQLYNLERLVTETQDQSSGEDFCGPAAEGDGEPGGGGGLLDALLQTPVGDLRHIALRRQLEEDVLREEPSANR